MPRATFGNPRLQIASSSAMSITIDSEWSSKFQQFLTLRRIPSFVDIAGQRVENRACDVLSLARGIDPERVRDAIADWDAALRNDRGELAATR